MPDIGGRRRVLRECIQIGKSSDLLCLADRLQGFIDRNDVSWSRRIDQFVDMLVNEAMIKPVKVGISQKIANTQFSESSIAPNTDCSASIECGGRRKDSNWGSVCVFIARIILPS